MNNKEINNNRDNTDDVDKHVNNTICNDTICNDINQTDSTNQNINKINVFREFGCTYIEGKFILKIGTLYGSRGNITGIKKNISDQLSKRVQSFDLEYIHSIKFCVPIICAKTRFCVEQSCRETFAGMSELFVDIKPEYPNMLFVKVLFPKLAEVLNIVNIDQMKISYGKVSNMAKNIKSQFEIMKTKYSVQINNHDAEIIRFTVPIHNNDTKLGIEQFLRENYPDSKHRILRLISGIFMVDIFLR
jgi:hypothetical protein